MSERQPELVATVDATLRSDINGLEALAWSPDGRLLVSWAHHATVVWDTVTAKPLANLGGAKSVTWSPDSQRLALLSNDATVTILSPTSSTKSTHLDLANSGTLDTISWHPEGDLLAASSLTEQGLEFFLWDIVLQRLRWRASPQMRASSYADEPRHLSWSPNGRLLAGNGHDCGVHVFDVDGNEITSLEGHWNFVDAVVWAHDGSFLVSASLSDGTIRIWNSATWQAMSVIERQPSLVDVGYTAICSLSHDDQLLTSLWIMEENAESTDYSLASPALQVRRNGSWDIVLEDNRSEINATAFHPSRPLLAVLVGNGEVQLWNVDTAVALATTPVVKSTHYANARILLVGDSGVGKSGLGLVLAGEPFMPTESTHGRRIWVLDSFEIELEDRRELREILLWDLAGQPGYRLVHQLYLDQADVALLVFDARSETDPLAGVGYWARALRQVEQFTDGRSIGKLLVAARTDRGTVAVNPARLKEVMSSLNLDAYFETSAKEGWGISDLAMAIHKAVNWEAIPRVISTELFLSIKSFLVAEKEAGRLLTTPSDLMASYLRQAVQNDLAGISEDESLPVWQRTASRLLARSQTADLTGAELLRRSLERPHDSSNRSLLELFEVCIGRVESQALIRQLSFGSLILLQPELFDVYAAAIVNGARQEPDGLGSIPEEDVLTLRFPMPSDERVADLAQERLLLIATVEELLRREIALREQTEEGPQLVFPSVSTRDRPDSPSLPKASVIFTFDGPVANVYATLVVRLSRSGLFQRREMWRTAVLYNADIGGTCGLLIHHDDEGHAELGLFFADETSEETRFNYEAYVKAHLERRALAVRRWRVFLCSECHEAISSSQAAKRRERGFDFIRCPVCETRISLLDREERLGKPHTTVVSEMDHAADAARDRAANVTVVGARWLLSTSMSFFAITASTSRR